MFIKPVTFIWNVRVLLWLMWCSITWVRLMWCWVRRLLRRIRGVRWWWLIWIWRCTWIRHCFILTVIVCWRNSVVCQVNHDNKLCLFGISVFDSALHFLSLNSLRSVYFLQNIWLHYIVEQDIFNKISACLERDFVETTNNSFIFYTTIKYVCLTSICTHRWYN